VGGEFVRDITPGEIVFVTKEGIKSDTAYDGRRTSQCIFELIYFARPDSVLDKVSISMARQAAGKRLATEHPAKADIVIGVLDSGIEAAVGYSRQSGIPYGIGLIKNRYVGRAFISHTQGRREQAVKLKLNPLRKNIEGKRVVLVDDSIVRGTTCKRIVGLLRDAGAKEVHMRVSAPPFLNPCYFGTDIPNRDILIAHSLTVDEIREEIGADSLGYLSVEGLSDVAAGSSLGFCDACFTGNYPISGGEDE
jgi:amidophosphoribosyltransferase